MSADERVSRYADVLLDTCLGVQPGWQVLVWGTPWGRPLLEVVMRKLAERGAYPLLRLTFGGGLVHHHAWLRHAPLEVIAEPAAIEVEVLRRCDAILAVGAPEDTHAGSDIAPERLSAVSAAYLPAMARLNQNELPWVMCWYPTPALAAEAGMAPAEFEDFLYRACLVDWKAEHARISVHAKRFDAASEVRIAGEGTDLVMSIAGRSAEVDAGFGNMPGGELFMCPVETSAQGTIAFTEFPAVRGGRQLRGVRLRFADGVVVDAAAETEEAYLLETLDTDAGARRIGELGIGANPAIDRHLGNVHFDEKIDGTVHIAVGSGFAHIGGTNESAVHWDIVKDLRPGGRIELDGRVIQENGKWVT
jgi:aminopeptidase